MKKSYSRKSTGEKELFMQIWNERDRRCSNCHAFLGWEPKTWNFAHIKPKSTHPELRLSKENIALLCWDCHYALDFGGKEIFNKRKR